MNWNELDFEEIAQLAEEAGFPSVWCDAVAKDKNIDDPVVKLCILVIKRISGS